MIFVIIAIVLGLVFGLILPVPSDQTISLYFVVGIFSALDSILGAIRASLEYKYDNKIFISGFLVNSVLAMILAYVGDKLSLPLYYAAIFVFGTRLFSNSSIIRRYLMDYKKNERKTKIPKNRRRFYSMSLKKRKI